MQRDLISSAVNSSLLLLVLTHICCSCGSGNCDMLNGVLLLKGKRGRALGMCARVTGKCNFVEALPFFPVVFAVGS